MPRKCCVPGCKSNYESIRKQNLEENYVTTFSFPKDPNRRDEWIRAIPRKDWTSSSGACVCRKHFSDNDIIDSEQFTLPDGGVNTVLLRCPKLKSDAVPHIFDNLPKYLSSASKCSSRRDPGERQTRIMKRQQDAIDSLLKQDIIMDFNELQGNYSKNLNMFGWEVKVCDKDVYFYLLCFKNGVQVKSSISIDNNLKVGMYI